MNVVLAHRTVLPRDAVGQDVQRMAEILGRSHRVGLFAAQVAEGVAPRLEAAAARAWLEGPDSLLIYHHSLFWEAGETLLAEARGRVIIKDHNITPPEYFTPYSELYADLCGRGRDQTRRLAERHPEAAWVGDSRFNLADAGLLGLPRASVLPPFNRIDRWAGMTPHPGRLRSLLGDRRAQALFVGRQAPNKGLHFLLDVARAWVPRYGPTLQIHLVGRRDPELAVFHAAFDAEVAASGLGDVVRVAGELPEPELLAYYLGCDAYLNASEHEGFCLPLAEAQSLHLPVLSRSGTAAPETLGPDQLVLDDDPAEFAAGLRLLTTRPEWSEWLQARGRANYESRFANDVIAARFADLVRECTGVAA